MSRAATHARSMPNVSRILVPVDHSPGLEAVIDYACVVARGLGASLTLLHVYEPPNEMVGVVAGATVAGEESAEHTVGGTLLDHAAALVHAGGIASVDRILERATPATRAIVSHARTGKFDLIVMGTHARRGVSRLVMGSVLDSVLHDAPCPVLAIHLPPD